MEKNCLNAGNFRVKQVVFQTKKLKQKDNS